MLLRLLVLDARDAGKAFILHLFNFLSAFLLDLGNGFEVVALKLTDEGGMPLLQLCSTLFPQLELGRVLALKLVSLGEELALLVVLLFGEGGKLIP